MKIVMIALVLTFGLVSLPAQAGESADAATNEETFHLLMNLTRGDLILLSSGKGYVVTRVQNGRGFSITLTPDPSRSQRVTWTFANVLEMIPYVSSIVPHEQEGWIHTFALIVEQPRELRP